MRWSATSSTSVTLSASTLVITKVTWPAGTVSGLAAHPPASVTVMFTCPSAAAAASAALPEGVVPTDRDADPDSVPDELDAAGAAVPQPASSSAPAVKRMAGRTRRSGVVTGISRVAMRTDGVHKPTVTRDGGPLPVG